MKDAIVLYPSPGIGHLISMVELGKLILTRHPSFSVTIFITPSPFDAGATSPYIRRVAATTSITFRHLPDVSLPPNSLNPPELLVYEIPRLCNPNVRQALGELSEKSKIRAFILDFFCNAAFEVSTGLGVPTYYFCPSGANALSLFLNFPTIDQNIPSIKELNDYIHIPGTPPIHSSDMPNVLFDRETEFYKMFLDTAKNKIKSSGILVNTFESLEPRAVQAFVDGLCVPNAPTPPIYCIGPLIANKNESSDNKQNECLKWLDLQPSKSVVFLCFGSIGRFKAEHLKEMAEGLENSGHRFLWVVRGPPSDDETRTSSAGSEPDLDSLLPPGFFERTKDRGFVVKSWAPQMEVLNHDSVGGFVTHCGWNSVLEAICAGVPMVGWPLYAEQRMNRVHMVEEMKVALPLTELEDGFVTAAELEKRVKELMDSESESGNAIRNKVMAMKKAGTAALLEGGSSYIAFEKLIYLWTT